MKKSRLFLPSLTLVALLASCGGSEEDPKSSTNPPADATAPPADEEEGHAHDEVPLATVTVGDFSVELKQGHGVVTAGMEGHLVVKLPYNDAGATLLRAWIGTEDRTASLVGKGDYAASHDDYDIHAMAPDPLPENVQWWFEIEKPDGTKVVGSAKPILK